MPKLRDAFTILILFSAFPVLSGQVPGTIPPAGPPLTLEQATAMAIKAHPQVGVAQNMAAAAGQHITEARSAYYPAIDGEITASQGLYQSRLGAGSITTSLLFNRIGSGLQMTQLLTDFGRTKNLVAQSRYQSEAAAQATQATIYDVVLGVNRAYYGVLEAQAYVDVANQTVRARDALANQVTTLANAQLKSQVDVSFAQVNLSEARLLLIRSQDAVERAYADLARAMGQDRTVRYPLAAAGFPPALSSSPDTLIADAIQNRPELRNLRLQLQAAKSFEQAEADLKRPDVSFIGVGGVLPYLDQNPHVAPHEYEALAVNVDVPIFNGHLFTARHEAARYEAQASDQRLRNLQQQIERDVRTTWITASTAYQRIPVTAELLKQAQLALDLAQGRYDLGLASIVEITQAQLNLTQAQIENVTAKYDYQSAYAELQYAIGALR
ncbi:MAG: TolC family protein [Bryobacteraceae bacterium]|jgi:outer membrane protein